MSLTPHALAIAATFCPYPLTGVADAELADIVDAWLADEFARDSHRHIHGWSEEDVR